LCATAIALLLPGIGGRAGARGIGAAPASQTLYAQSAGRILRERFSDPGISYLVLDAQSGSVVASRWEEAEVPIPLGSLVKPFAALAYGQQHEYRFPSYVCRGTATGCWLPHGHGSVALTQAIAYSCNSYFRSLTEGMTSADVVPTAVEYRLDLPAQEVSGVALAGLGNRWAVAPLHAARAYLELVRRREQPGIREIVAGIRESARSGTGEEVSRSLLRTDALVKTGTAACTHAQHGSGDGFVVALSPSDDPKILLMVRVHGVPGAEASKVAGRMLHSLEE
jgi:hypothetical protein